MLLVGQLPNLLNLNLENNNIKELKSITQDEAFKNLQVNFIINTKIK